ncbi:MAG TPA: SH3 domain-containing protein [Coleofasciculaceae cyanobacterium]
MDSRVWADPTSSDVTANTGIVQDSIVGNQNQQNQNVGIGANGDITGNANNNQNTLGASATANPITVVQPQYNTGSGGGGNAALVLPRNPLALPNATAGRSNFGLQFGVQNNPGLGALSGGGANALGWFMQGGLTVPFGKIPSIYYSPKNAEMDSLREDHMDAQRNVFGNANPINRPPAQAKVEGRVVGLNAYNYSTVPAGKLPLQMTNSTGVGEIVAPQPKVLALKQADAFNQPLNTGERVGAVEVGKEYVYLGHTRSGWVKVLLSNGREAWTSTQFEYIKFDYTEIDSLAVAPQLPVPAQEASKEAVKTPVSVSNQKPKPVHSASATSTKSRHSRRRRG